MADVRFRVVDLWGGGSCDVPKRRESKVRKRERAGDRTVLRVCTTHCGEGIPWVALGETAPLPRVHLEDGILPLQGQKAHQESLSAHSTAGDIGMHAEDR